MKINTKPLPGMLELLPEEQLEFDRILEIIRKSRKIWFFSDWYASDWANQNSSRQSWRRNRKSRFIVLIKATTIWVLRFDLTVPFNGAFCGGKFLVSFISVQAFADRQSLSWRAGSAWAFSWILSSATSMWLVATLWAWITTPELLAVIYEIFRELNFGKFKIRINNRNITSGLLEGLNLLEKSTEIMALIDRAERFRAKNFDSQLSKMDLGEENSAKIKQFISISGESAKVIDELRILGETFENNSRFLAGVSELEKVAEILKKWVWVKISSSSICWLFAASIITPAQFRDFLGWFSWNRLGFERRSLWQFERILFERKTTALALRLVWRDFSGVCTIWGLFLTKTPHDGGFSDYSFFWKWAPKNPSKSPSNSAKTAKMSTLYYFKFTNLQYVALFGGFFLFFISLSMMDSSVKSNMEIVAHEMTHAFFALLTLHKVTGIRVEGDNSGGNMSFWRRRQLADCHCAVFLSVVRFLLYDCFSVYTHFAPSDLILNGILGFLSAITWIPRRLIKFMKNKRI